MPMKNGQRTHNAASLIVDDCRALPVKMRPVTREIHHVYTPAAHQGQGDATELLHSVCAEADDAGITLVLWPQPYGDDIALSRQQLIDWYSKRFGFVQIQPDPPLMARMPGSTPHYLTPAAAAARVYG